MDKIRSHDHDEDGFALISKSHDLSKIDFSNRACTPLTLADTQRAWKEWTEQLTYDEPIPGPTVVLTPAMYDAFTASEYADVFLWLGEVYYGTQSEEEKDQEEI